MNPNKELIKRCYEETFSTQKYEQSTLCNTYEGVVLKALSKSNKEIEDIKKRLMKCPSCSEIMKIKEQKLMGEMFYDLKCNNCDRRFSVMDINYWYDVKDERDELKHQLQNELYLKEEWKKQHEYLRKQLQTQRDDVIDLTLKINKLVETIEIQDKQKDDMLKQIEKICHKLGKPDLNGENHIIGIDGMHWKELAEIFEKHLKQKNIKGKK